MGGFSLKVSGLLIVLLGCLLALASFALSEPTQDGERRALVIFTDGGGEGGRELLQSMSRLDGFSLGLMSASQGRDVPTTQTYLDIGQGARTDYSLYGPLPGDASTFVRNGRGIRADAITALNKRAARPPEALVPGLLAQMLERAGVQVAYVAESGPAGGQGPALAAIDRDGVIGQAGLAGPMGRLYKPGTVVIASLSPGPALTAARRSGPGDLVVLIRRPQMDEGPSALWPLALRGLGGGMALSSSSTRLPGLVSSVDLAATLSDWFGLKPPGSFQGRPITTVSKVGAGGISKLEGRLSVISKRRLPAVAILFIVAALMALVAAALRGRRGLKFAIRTTALALFLLPAVLLADAALDTGPAAEYAFVATAALGFGAACACALPFKLAPIVAVLLSVVATTIDLVFGLGLTQLSLLGPNPAYGARFFGIGNELEAMLAISFLLACGPAAGLVPKGRTIYLVAMGTAFAFVLGYAGLGADVGGVLVIAVGVAVTVAVIARIRPLITVVAAVAVPLIALLLLLAIDLASGSGAHLERTVGGGAGEIVEAAGRRLMLSYRSLGTAAMAVPFAIACLLLIAGWLKRDSLLAPLHRRGEEASRAVVWGALAATLCGLLVNDSGPLVLTVGTMELLFYLGYVWSAPNGV